MAEDYEVVSNGSLAYYLTIPTNYSNSSEKDYPLFPLEIPHIKAIINTCYILVFICCIVGNLLVILVVLVHQKMRTITNFFLANLAVADFLVGVFCVLPTMEYMNNPVWRLGRVMCKIHFFVQCTTYNASIAILTAISIERYFAIIHPMRSKQMTTICLLRVVVIVIWIFAAVTGSPLLYFYDIMETSPLYGEVTSYCMVKLNVIPYIRAYVTVSFVFLYLLPLLVMSIIYMRISIVLWKTSRPDGQFRNTVGGNKEAHKGHNTRAFFKPSKGKLVSFSKTVVRLDDTGYEPIATKNAHTCTSSSDEAKRKDPTTKNGAAYTGSEEDQSFAMEDGASDEVLEAQDYENDWPTARRSPPDGIKLYRKTVATTSDPESGDCGPTARLSSPAVNRMSRQAVTQKVQGRRQNALTARRKVVRLLIAVVLAFTLCLLPYHINFMMQYWSQPPEPTFTKFLISTIIPLIMYFQSGLNPILYAFLSENFRKSLHDMVCCRNRRSHHQRSVRSTTGTTTVKNL